MVTAGRHGPRARLLGVLLAFGLASCDASPVAWQRPNLLQPTPAGGLAIADFHNHQIVVLGPTGAPQQRFGELGLGPGQLWRIWGLLAGPDDRLIVLNRRLRSLADKRPLWEIKEFVRGVEVRAIRLPLPAPERPTLLAGPAPAPDGGFFVGEGTAGLLLRYTADWQLVEQRPAPRDGPPFGPISALRRRGDDLWLVEQYRHRVRRLAGDGRQLLLLEDEGSGPGELLFPAAVDCCPAQGWLAVADTGNLRVQRFDLQGRPLDGFSPAPARPDRPVQLRDLLVSPDCSRLYLLDSTGNRLLVTTPQGELLQVLP